ncbi:hypothetical protein [Streptomyces sp. NPDC048442]|uniref:hypothetical protein n=1 Tax=Streptomyces sp. NPDC048442 TaxID=3154823 RepID=UPI00342523F7
MQVTVTVTDCPAQDARAVFEVLAAGFGDTDRGPDDVPREVPGAGPTVWTSVFEADGSDGNGKLPAPTPLSGPATVTVQGVPHEVTRVREVLGAAFGISDEGSASGDQEQEVRLRVSGR